MTTTIGINDSDRKAVAFELAKLLADEYVLSAKTRNAHWNVEGPDFYEKHKFFEGQFSQLDEIIDRVAERIRALGHFAPAKLKSFLELTHLAEPDENTNCSSDYIKDLLADHETIIMHLRGDIHTFGNEYNDFGTSDFITGLMVTHEKMAWFLRAHLQ